MFNKKCFVSLILLALLLGSCSSAPDDTSGDTSAPTSADTAAEVTEEAAEETVPEETEPDWYANIPEGTTFDGYTFSALSYDYSNGNWSIYLAPAEMIGEVLNDAAYQRNTEVEELLGIEIEEILDGNSETSFKNSIMAGDGETYDLIAFWSPGDRASFITSNLVYDWKSLPNTDLTAAWYNQTANDAYEFVGKQYFAVSDYTFPVHQHFRILFNKDLMKDLNLELPYESVHNGTWTFDKMMDYTSGVYSDLDGNGQADLNDRYGIVLNAAFTSIFPINSGELPVTCTDEGFQFNLYSDRIISIVERMQAFRTNQDVYLNLAGGNTQYEIFQAGNAIFEPYGSDPKLLRDIEFDLGYLPYPKFDENQEDYVVWSSGGMMALPVTLTNAERTGAIIEALSAGSSKYVKDAFVEQYIEGKVLRDEDSQIIYRMMCDKATYDLSYNIDPSGKIGEYKWYSTFVNDAAANPASYWESQQKAINKTYNNLFEKIKGN
ncbi:MAG: hypothetical protein J6N32_00545 [Clostridia bacterium]|nr:hypothetical protein [Clostridia bacterium]